VSSIGSRPHRRGDNYLGPVSEGCGAERHQPQAFDLQVAAARFRMNTWCAAAASSTSKSNERLSIGQLPGRQFLLEPICDRHGATRAEVRRALASARPHGRLANAPTGRRRAGTAAAASGRWRRPLDRGARIGVITAQIPASPADERPASTKALSCSASYPSARQDSSLRPPSPQRRISRPARHHDGRALRQCTPHARRTAHLVHQGATVAPAPVRSHLPPASSARRLSRRESKRRRDGDRRGRV
jgi:hypothetical protein